MPRSLAYPDPSHLASLPLLWASLPGVGSSTLSAVGTTGGVRMLGGDSGRFLCFCLRRSLSFRLWGRTRDQVLVLGNSWGEDDMCMWAVDPSQRWTLWMSSPPWRDGGGTLAEQERFRQVPLRANSPSSFLSAKNSLSHYHTSDTEHHTHEHAPARVSTGDMELCRGMGARHTVT